MRPSHLLLALLAAGTLIAQQTKAPVEHAVHAPLAPKSLLLDLARAGDAVVAVGERGHILISSDGGSSWTQVDVPTRATLTGVDFRDATHGWAVGHDAVILRTRDGGRSWERVHWAPEEEAPLLDVLFLDGRRGFAVGAYGTALVTDDGGATWSEQPVADEDYHLNQIARAPSGRLYLAAEAGHAYRSDDEGASWVGLETPYEGSFFGVLPLEGDAVLLFGLRGHLFRSEDAGASWTPIETGTEAMLNSGARLADGRIVIVGLGGVVLVSTDGGRSFTLREQATRTGLQALAEGAGGRLVVSGEAGAYPLALGAAGPRGSE